MTTDEYGLRSMSNIDPVDLRMSSRPWELQVITQGVSMIHAEFSKFRVFCTEYFNGESTKQGGSLALIIIIKFDAWDSTMFYRYSKSWATDESYQDW